MALRDYYSKADVLDSLGWMGLAHEKRVAKLANLYLHEEGKIRSRSRNYDGPTKNTVSLLMRSMFTPPRGLGKQTIQDTLEEIERQRKLRHHRATERKPYEPKKLSLLQRRNNVAKRLYSTYGSDYYDKRSLKDPNVVGMTEIAGCLMVVDKGDYYTSPRVFLKHKATGRRKLIVFKRDTKCSTVTNALIRMAPKVALRGMFEGKSIMLDFDGEGFVVGDQLKPWRNVVKVYRDDEVMNSEARPS